MKRGNIGIALVLAAAVAAAGWIFIERQPQEVGNNMPTITEDGTLATTTPAYDVEITPPAAGLDGAEVVVDHIAERNTTFITEAREAYDAYTEDSPEYPWRQYMFVVEHDVYDSESVTSYIVREYRYTGGANGIQLVETFTYGPDGEELSLTDVVPAGSRDALVGAVREELYEMNGGSDTTEGTFDGAISSLTFDDLEHFYITEDELIIAFQEYEVAPGAAGAVEVALPRGTFSSI